MVESLCLQLTKNLLTVSPIVKGNKIFDKCQDKAFFGFEGRFRGHNFTFKGSKLTNGKFFGHAKKGLADGQGMIRYVQTSVPMVKSCLKPDGPLGIPHDVDIQSCPRWVAESGEERLQNLEQASIICISMHHDVQDARAYDLKRELVLLDKGTS